jgi:hypothetical protein
LDAAITQELPPKVNDWNEDWSAPTETYQTPKQCPFDWEYIQAHTNGLHDNHIQAYVRREPWNPEEHQKPFGVVLKEVNDAGDTSVSVEEAIRKRFRIANLRVYETTGVYFENNILGVDKKYNLLARKNRPMPSKARNAGRRLRLAVDQHAFLTNEENKQPAAATYAFILQPPPLPSNDRCTKCCEEGDCYDRGCIEDDCCDQCCYNEWLCKRCSLYGERRDGCVSFDCEDIECKCPCIHHPVIIKEAHSVEKYQEVLKKKGAPFGCPNPAHEPLIPRYVVANMLDEFSYQRFKEETLLRVEPKAFDLFTSCIVLGLRHGFPQRLLRLSRRDPEIPDEGMMYEDAGDDYSLGDIFKAYCCAQVLQCPAVSETLLNHLLTTLKAEDAIACRESSSMPIGDTPVTHFSILDVQREHLKYVFQNTAPDDPIRLLLLDIISDKTQDRRSKISKTRSRVPSRVPYRRAT